MRLYKLGRDGKPQPAAGQASRTRARPVPAPEAVKDIRRILRRDALACVRHSDADVVAHALRAHPHAAGRRRVAYAVRDQIAQHLVQPARVAVYGERFSRFDLDSQFHAGGLGQRPEAGGDVRQQVGHVYRLPAQRQLAGFGEGQGAEIVHQPRQRPRFLQGGLDVVRRRRIDRVENALQIALDDVQRRAQFVGDVRRQIAPLAVGARQLGRHAVERARQPAEVLRTALLHLHLEVARGHGVGRVHDVCQGRGIAVIGAGAQYQRKYGNQHDQTASAEPNDEHGGRVAAKQARASR